MPKAELKSRLGAADRHPSVLPHVLKKLRLTRRQALHRIGTDRLAARSGSGEADVRRCRRDRPCRSWCSSPIAAADSSAPVVSRCSTMGPWLNIMDPTFHMDAGSNGIAEIWAVRKPTKDGHVTSLSAFRRRAVDRPALWQQRRGADERSEWRALIENLRPQPVERRVSRDMRLASLLGPALALRPFPRRGDAVRCTDRRTTALPDTSRVTVTGGSLLEIVYALGEDSKAAARYGPGCSPCNPRACSMWAICARALPRGRAGRVPHRTAAHRGLRSARGPRCAGKGLEQFAVTVPEGYSHEGPAKIPG